MEYGIYVVTPYDYLLRQCFISGKKPTKAGSLSDFSHPAEYVR